MERLSRVLFELQESRIKNFHLPAFYNDSIQILTESASRNTAIRFINPTIHVNNMSLTKEELFEVLMTPNETWFVRYVDFTLDSEWNNHFNGPISVIISNTNRTVVITIKCGFAKIM